MKISTLAKIFSIVIAAFFGLLIVSSALAGDPTGGSPLDPLMVPTAWSNIAANTTVWYYFDYDASGSAPRFGRGGGSGKSTVNVTVEANGASGIQFAIYTPTQGTDWLRDQSIAPVGRGSPYRDTSTGNIARDLYWSGAFNTGGRYFVAVKNESGNTISFRLTVTGDTVTLYPLPTPTPTETIPAIFAPVPAPTATIQGKVVFQTSTGGAIYTVNGDGSDLKLLSSGIDPAWSPDGKQIAYARWGATFPGLYVMDADGANEHLVYGAPRIRSPRWSADGKYIAFTQEKTTGRDTKWKLGVIELNKAMDAETTRNALTEPQCTNGCLAPSWGADSRTLMYTDPQSGIMATSIISGSAKLVMGPTGMYFDTTKNVGLPIEHLPSTQSSMTSPDGARIAYAQAAHDRWELHWVNADGSNRTAITTPNQLLYTFWHVVTNNVAPVWSPDSKEILFLSDRNGKWEFFVANADGSNVRQALKNVTDQIRLGFDFQNERMMDWTSGGASPR